MKLSKRAQGSTEYLIVLAIVIIIALIVVAAMGGIPAIGGGASNRAAASYWSSQDVAVTDFVVSAGGADTVIIKNNLRNSISLQNVFVNSVDLVAGADAIGVGSSKTYSGAIAACTAGQSFSYNVSVTYSDTTTSGNFTVNSNGNNLEGTCAS